METNLVVNEPIVLMVEKITHRKLAIVDIDQVGNNPELLEDLVDIITAIASRNDELLPWEIAKQELKQKGIIQHHL